MLFYCPLVKGFCQSRECLKGLSCRTKSHLEIFYSTKTTFPRHDRCQSCKSPLKQFDFSCSVCSKIQDISKYSYFDLFFKPELNTFPAIKVSSRQVNSTNEPAKETTSNKPNLQKGSFEVDLAKLKIQFYQLQQKYHPDNSTINSIYGEESLASISASLNKAYNTLRDPFTRANYLMFLNTNNNSFEEEGDIEDYGERVKFKSIDAEFLTKILTYHEIIEECSDSSNPQVQKIQQEALEEIHKCIESFKKQFNSHNYKHCHEILAKWKYWKNIVDEIK